MERKIKILSKQSERVAKRKGIAYRPESLVYTELERRSRKKGISLNQVLNEIVLRDIKKKGVRLAKNLD